MEEPQIQFDSSKERVICRGMWDLKHLTALQTEINQFKLPKISKLIVDGRDIESMDSAGAWLLGEWLNQLKEKGVQVSFENFADNYTELLKIVTGKLQEKQQLPTVVPENPLASIGKTSIAQLLDLKEFLSFLGLITTETLRISRKPDRLRYQTLAGVIYRNGYQALPIIALLSFMIGVVITYQMGLQLKNYGANIYIVDLLGISVLREFSPLLTAIMVAGRTGSAFTAQLGMMKLNQEIDALNTMGVTPTELLIIPRIVGLFIALPLLTIWSDIFGVLGGMVMSNNMLDITWYDFMNRFPHVIKLKTLLLGLGKAPVFALLIASIGCFQGMKVYGGADSVGRNTTRSVVLAIFFIIVADALFSVLFSKLKL